MGLAPRQWVILLTFYVVYLIFGASVFYEMEHELETDRRAKALQERIEINGNICMKNVTASSFFSFDLLKGNM